MCRGRSGARGLRCTSRAPRGHLPAALESAGAGVICPGSPSIRTIARVGAPMRTETSVGVALGVLLAALSVGFNALRADVHYVSSFPNLAVMLVPPLAIYVASRRARASNRKAMVTFG